MTMPIHTCLEADLMSFLRGATGVRSVPGWGLSYHLEISFPFQEGDPEPGKQQPEMLPQDFGPLLHISSQGIMQRGFLLHQKNSLWPGTGSVASGVPAEHRMWLWICCSAVRTCPAPLAPLKHNWIITNTSTEDCGKILPFPGKGRFIETTSLQGHNSGSSCKENFHVQDKNFWSEWDLAILTYSLSL